MNPIVFALRRPITIVTSVVAVLLLSFLVLTRMKVDVFPTLNLPVIYVCQPYGGMDPAQMEGLITNYYEYHFLYINGIKQIESKNVQGVALMKLEFHPGTDMAIATAEVVAGVNRSRANMPAGTVPPFVTRFDTGSVPVGYVVLDSETRAVGEVQNYGIQFVRPIFASLPGVSTPPPFGGSPKAVLVNVDPDRMRSYNLSPEDVLTALTYGNVISPSGNVRIGDQMPQVPVNAMVTYARELGGIPVRPGENVYLRDVASIEEGTDIQTGYVLVNGRRSVFMLVTKRAEASTTDVVNEIRKALPKMRAVVPEDVNVRFEFDQSPVVTNSMKGVLAEGLIGAALTGLMVLLFLRDWRSVIVVVINIPLALLSAVIALWLGGQTINLMTLGGLALAVGILVDESTVEVENIHAQMSQTDSVARAVRRGNAETAVPRLLAMLCVLAVFIPSFMMEGAARGLFVPLSLAVGFAMIGSYILSSTLVPVLSVWLLRHHSAATVTARGWMQTFHMQGLYERLVSGLTDIRWLLVPAYLAGTLAALAYIGPRLGTEIFPNADTGLFLLRFRAATGTRIEQTEQIALKSLEIVKELAGDGLSTGDHVQSVGYVGVIPSQYPVQCVYQWMSGPEEFFLRIGLPKNRSYSTAEFKSRLRKELLPRLRPWLAAKLRREGMAEADVASRIDNLRISLEAADIINEVMSFGSRTPIEVLVHGPKMPENRAFAEKVYEQLKKVPGLVDLQFVQAMDYPTVEVNIDREKAGQTGVTTVDVTRSLTAATSSSRFVMPNYWRDPTTGMGFLVQVQVPPSRMDEAKQVGMIPVKPNGTHPVLVRDVADVRISTQPAEIDRVNMRRSSSIVGNIEGTDLGRVAAAVKAAVRSAGEAPRGVQVDVRGQVEPLEQIFRGLSVGLVLAVFVILLLLTAYFQSIRLAFVSIASVPAVLAGVALTLYWTRTTLNLQSFIGAIMAIGVAVANAILLVTFAERARHEGMSAKQAAISGAKGRLRAIIMTSCAMVAGMIPMALGYGEGGDTAAPLGRAVAGGLIASTIATLLIVPSVFSIAMRNASLKSDSLDPDDPESPHYSSTADLAAES